jgi:hypothetical protein
VTDPPIDRRRVVVVAAVSSVLIAAVGLVAYDFGGDVPRGTRVLGVDIGAKSRSDAERVLHHRFDPHADDPVEVDLDGRPIVIHPAEIAMTLDVDLTVAKAIHSGRPMLTGSRESPPVIHLDRARLVDLLGGKVKQSVAATAVQSAWLTDSQVSLSSRGP